MRVMAGEADPDDMASVWKRLREEDLALVAQIIRRLNPRA
jgi:hypothetical protein